MELDEQLRRQLARFQRNEITEHHIYARLANTPSPSENRQILERIAADELRHYKTGSDTRKRRSSRIG